MGNHFFRFKQFTVFHNKCAMKVGTDGVLLGAWSNFADRRSVLDVGTGSGLIALMAAQQNSLSKIVAVEIDQDAATQAKENVECSPFKDRILVLNVSLQDFATDRSEKFDIVVSNPPYFVNSLLSPDTKRTDARHADRLSVTELMSLSKILLSDMGILSVIYPFAERDNVLSAATKEKLYLSRETIVYSMPLGLPKRVLLEFRATRAEKTERHRLIIQEKRHVYTLEFTELVKDFYLYL